MRVKVRKRAPRTRNIEFLLLDTFAGMVLNTMLVLTPGDKPMYDADVISAWLKAVCGPEYEQALALAQADAKKRWSERTEAVKEMEIRFTSVLDNDQENGGGTEC